MKIRTYQVWSSDCSSVESTGYVMYLDIMPSIKIRQNPNSEDTSTNVRSMRSATISNGWRSRMQTPNAAREQRGSSRTRTSVAFTVLYLISLLARLEERDARSFSGETSFPRKRKKKSSLQGLGQTRPSETKRQWRRRPHYWRGRWDIWHDAKQGLTDVMWSNI